MREKACQKYGVGLQYAQAFAVIPVQFEGEKKSYYFSLEDTKTINEMYLDEDILCPCEIKVFTRWIGNENATLISICTKNSFNHVPTKDVSRILCRLRCWGEKLWELLFCVWPEDQINAFTDLEPFLEVFIYYASLNIVEHFIITEASAQHVTGPTLQKVRLQLKKSFWLSFDAAASENANSTFVPVMHIPLIPPCDVRHL